MRHNPEIAFLGARHMRGTTMASKHLWPNGRSRLLLSEFDEFTGLLLCFYASYASKIPAFDLTFQDLFKEVSYTLLF